MQNLHAFKGKTELFQIGVIRLRVLSMGVLGEQEIVFLMVLKTKMFAKNRLEDRDRYFSR